MEEGKKGKRGNGEMERENGEAISSLALRTRARVRV